jgi:hypothetical protein
MKKYIILEPSAIDFWKSVVIGFLLKCRFAVGIGFGIEKSCRFKKKKSLFLFISWPDSHISGVL